MNTINPLTAVKPLDSSTSDSGSRQQFQQQAKPGQTFTATVLGSAGGNKFSLNINGQSILAQSDTVSLSAGSEIKLQVVTTSPLIELKIISDTPQLNFGKTITLLGKNFDIGSLFQSLTSSSPPLLSSLSKSSQEGLQSFNILQQNSLDGKDGGQVLKTLIDRLGISLESLLAKGDNTASTQTLKAALLEIAALLKNAEGIAETANRLLGTLELYQMANLRLDSDNLLIFPLPLPFLDNGYLLFDKKNAQEGGKNKDTQLSFSLHLSLQPLGNIEIHFLQSDEGLYIRFACDSLEKKEFTSQFADDLKKTLTSGDVLGLSFSDTAGDPTGELIQHLVPEGTSMLDTKV